MKTIKIIDLLNKIANGEEIPKKIKIGNIIWTFDKKEKTYFMNDTCVELFYVENITKKLNDEVEILEEKEMCHKCHKYPAEYNQTYCEFCLGISELEEKKIPEKLNYKYINSFGNISQHKKSEEPMIDKINEILDYLESKGE